MGFGILFVENVKINRQCSLVVARLQMAHSHLLAVEVAVNPEHAYDCVTPLHFTTTVLLAELRLVSATHHIVEKLYLAPSKQQFQMVGQPVIRHLVEQIAGVDKLAAHRIYQRQAYGALPYKHTVAQTPRNSKVLTQVSLCRVTHKRLILVDNLFVFRKHLAVGTQQSPFLLKPFHTLFLRRKIKISIGYDTVKHPQKGINLPRQLQIRRTGSPHSRKPAQASY